MRAPNPTTKIYKSLDDAFMFFNRRLFGGRLPACLITMQRSKSAYGYFAGGWFGSKDGKEITDEIALNPSHFHERSIEQSLSTPVPEMAHLEQHHFGTIAIWLPEQGMGRHDESRRPDPVLHRRARRQGGRAEGQPLHRSRGPVRAR